MVLWVLNDKKSGSSIKNLSIGNLKIDRVFMEYLFDEILPGLYSIDFFNIKGLDDLDEKTFF